VALEEEESAQRRRLAPDGVRRQEVTHFAFTYSAGSRNAGEMLAFENRVEKILDKTYDFVADKLGCKLEKRTQVSLLSRAEYDARYAGTPQAQAAGFWDGRQIVINGGSEIDQRFAEVMVHEFTHAVVSDLSRHGQVPRWLHEGLAENMRLNAVGLGGRPEEALRAGLRELKRRGELPGLDALDSAFANLGPGAPLAYALAASAVRVLVEQRGYSELVEAIREMRAAGRACAAVERHFMSMGRLEQAVAEGL
jgi:hypothetical protein